MVIPNLAIDKNLHKTNSALNKSPSNETTGAIFASGGLVKPVKVSGSFALAGNVESFFSSGLHASRQFVAGNARFEIVLTGMPPGMFLIQFCQESKVLCLQFPFQM